MDMNNCQTNGFKKLGAFIFASVLSLLQVISICAQDNYISSAAKPGNSNGSFQLTSSENINPYTGGLNFSLPVLSVGGRGSVTSNVKIPVNQKYTVKRFITDSETNSGFYYVYDSYNDSDNITTDDVYSPGMMYMQQTGTGANPYCFGATIYQSTLTRINFVAPDGTQYIFRDRVNGGASFNYPGSCQMNGWSRGTVFDSMDGESAVYISDTEIFDEVYAGYPSISRIGGTVILRNGTKYRINAEGRVTWVQDRNGNRISYQYTTVTYGIQGRVKVSKITDSLNREINFEYNVQDVAPYGLCDRITYKGFGGADRTIRISYKNLSDVLRSGYSLQNQGVLFPDIFGVNNTYCYPWADNGMCASHTVNPLKRSAVWLPNNQSYKFYYNSHAEIARVEQPEGGAIEYDWTNGFNTGSVLINNMTPGNGERHDIYRRLTERRVYSDGVNLESKITVSGTEGLGNDQGYVTMDQYGSTNNLITRVKHFYYGMSGVLVEPDPYWRDGREYQTEVYKGDGQTLLRRTTNTWQQTGPNWYPGPPDTSPVNNPRVTETTTFLADSNQMSKQTYTYDAYGNVTDIYEYDFGNGAPGAFLRRKHTDFLTTNPVNSVNYTADGVHILNLPSQSWVSSDINGNTKVSRIKYEYDNYASDTNHAALVNRSGITGHDSNYGISYATRGNTTKITSYADAQNQTGDVSSYRQYDIAGNPVKGIDAKGYANMLDYSDRFGAPDAEARNNTAPGSLNGAQTYAFATSASNVAGFTTYTQFDYFTGKGVDSEDINGNVSSVFYNDSLDRPTQTIAVNNRSAYKNQATISYDAVNRKTTVTADSKVFGDNLIKSESFYDKMGRTIESRQYETGTDYIAALQEYDSLGRAYKTSNPYRPYLSEQPQWTTATFDALGRVIETKTPDNAVVTRSYEGTVTTVTDQASRTRRGRTNALGFLTNVTEDPTVTFGYETIYQYDVLGRLRKTTQGDQARYFMYDDLGRLIRAKQTEQTANSNLAVTDPVTGNSAWSVKYEYDGNGNVTSTTDSRGITISGTYDNLNRLTFRNYSDSTPDVAFTFDDINIANSKGKLTAVSSSVSATGYTAFDELGRIKSSSQTIDGQTYNFPDYTYDLSGAMVAQTYPSGRIVRTESDNIGRLSEVASQRTNQLERTYLSNLSYTAFGGISSAKLGNGRWESSQYDNKRLQLTQVGLGVSANDTSLLNIEYNYGTTTSTASDNNGSLRQQKISFNGLTSTITQNYTYDTINRLKTATETVANGATQTWKQTFEYDRYGNRRFDAANTTTLPANNSIYNPNIDADNKYLVSEGYNYDSEGNLTSNPENQLFQYDAENKQIQVQNTSTGATANYFYDGQGKRVKKVVGIEETIFVYDAFGKLVAEYTINQAITAEGTKYLTTDALGTPRVITNSLGEVVSRHDYMTFGEEVASNIGGRTTAQGYLTTADGVRQQYTGYERDIESGLDFAQNRYFASKHGRFTSVDPLAASASIKNPQTLNRYSYGLNSPYKFTDALGLKPDCQGPGGGNNVTTLASCDGGDEDPIPYEIEQVEVYVSTTQGGCSAEFSNCSLFEDPPVFTSDEAPNTHNFSWEVYRFEYNSNCSRKFGECYKRILDFNINIIGEANKMLNDLYAEAFSYYYSLEILAHIQQQVGGELAEVSVTIGGKIGFSGDKQKPVNGEINTSASGKITYVSIQKLKNDLQTALQGSNFTTASTKLAQLNYVNPKTGKTEFISQGMARDMIGLIKTKAKEQAQAAARDWIERTKPK